MKIDVYTQAGEVKGSVDLPKEIFEVEFNADLIHQALVRQQSNGRVAIAHTKLRGDVRGGGRKPFKQKGTGRARQGTIRAPHMKGGAIIFGPSKDRNFEKDMPKKQRRKALFSALSFKASSNSIVALEGFKSEKPQTKELLGTLQRMKVLPEGRSALIVLAQKDEIIQKSSNNLKNVKTVLAGYVNIQDLQKYSKLILLEDSIDKLQEVFLNKASK